MQNQKNILGVLPVGYLLRRFATPSIIAMLVGSFYNIVDQLFIGRSVGMYGNAATNVALPFLTVCMALALMSGIGGASGFNLNLGAGKKDVAAKYLATSLTMLVGGGLVFTVVAAVFMVQLLLAFGSTPDVMPYAERFMHISCLGLPGLVFCSGVSHLIRADGSPRYAMFSMILGALCNCLLNPLFIFGFGWGIAGSAWATVTGQFLSSAVSLWYIVKKYTSVQLKRSDFDFSLKRIAHVAALGSTSFFNQAGMMVVQIALNNSLVYYGAQSPYGSDIPLAAVGIITKVNMVFFGFIIGISQGMQPIASFNYGSGDYRRAAEAFHKALKSTAVISLASFLCFQLFAREIIALFGEGSELYFTFAERYFHIFLFGTLYNFFQPITSMFFTAIGKASKGAFISLTRQTLFLLPLIVILPHFFGIDGIMYAGVVADTMSASVAFWLGRWQISKFPRQSVPGTTNGAV